MSLILPAIVLASSLLAFPGLEKGRRISAADALAQAEKLFDSVEGCGYVEGVPTDDGDDWLFRAKVGYAGDLDPNPIMVDKATGIATWGSLDDSK